MWIKNLGISFEKIYRHPFYKIFLLLFGALSIPIVSIKYMSDKRNNDYEKLRDEIRRDMEKERVREKIYAKTEAQLKNKLEFFKKSLDKGTFQREVEEITDKRFKEEIDEVLNKKSKQKGVSNVTFSSTFKDLFNNKLFFAVSLVISFPMYLLILIFSNPYSKYIFERFIMMIFVIFGVTFLVFTILYSSPLNPALNILGQEATAEQIVQFNKSYGLDKPYIIQLLNTFKNLFSFNLGKSFAGNEDVLTAIARKFPVTLQLSFASLTLAIIIAIPAGIVSAIKPYSSFDYVFMLAALIGLSMPTFWLGLILILNFSINNHLLPSTFIVGNWKSLIMPSVVLGMALAASVARMTRSSMLEVKNMDYIVTARAKGLSERKVIIKHILGNAMIPIVTIIGLQFGQMLGGSAVTEKVFNINGIGSFIVDKQFIPDIPIVLAGVVYVAVVISLSNLVVDIVYSFLDPRIKSKMKNY